MRHLISLEDLTRDEIVSLIQSAKRLKSQVKSGRREPIFLNRVLGLLFEKPSLRTRVSFEVLMNQHGGSSLYLGSDVGWQKREPICDFIPVLTSYVDLLVIRSNNHQSLVEAARYSRCPIINGLTEISHPCQAIADIMTVDELLDGNLSDARIAFVGDGNNVAHSLAIICSKLGIPLAIAAPVDYQFADDWIKSLRSVDGKRHIWQTDDPVAAVRGANIVYTDVWTSMGQEHEHAKRMADFQSFQVNAKLFAHADSNARLLHCLPAHRGEEVTTDVIDSPASAVVQQAENRLHAQKALVAWLLEQS